MFTTPERLSKRTGRYSLPRFEYLQALVTEFQETEKEDAKTQVLANLANFSYDPINYDTLRKLNVVELFLDTLEDPTSEIMKEFALGGLCNLCIDPSNQKIIFENESVPHIVNCLSSTNEEVVLLAMTTLYYLVNQSSKELILTKPILGAFNAYSQAPSKRLSNLAKAFLKKFGDDKRGKLVESHSIEKTQPVSRDENIDKQGSSPIIEKEKGKEKEKEGQHNIHQHTQKQHFQQHRQPQPNIQGQVYSNTSNSETFNSIHNENIEQFPPQSSQPFPPPNFFPPPHFQNFPPALHFAPPNFPPPNYYPPPFYPPNNFQTPPTGHHTQKPHPSQRFQPYPPLHSKPPPYTSRGGVFVCTQVGNG